MLETAVEEIRRRWVEETESRIAHWRRRALYQRLDRLVPELEEYCMEGAPELPRDVYRDVVSAVQESDERLGKRAAGQRAPAKLLDCLFDAQEIELRKMGAGPFEGENDDADEEDEVG
jgi:hypothetical protein